MTPTVRFLIVRTLAFLVPVAALGACGEEPVEEPRAKVQGGVPVVRDVDVTLRYPIELMAAEQVSVAPVAVSGFLKNVLVDVGDKVEEGQLIATLDCREYAAQGAQVSKSIAQRQAQLDESKTLLDRLLAMNDDQLIAPAELDRARAAYRVSEAQVAEARAKMSEVSQRQGYCSLKAPFDGYVSSRILDPGAMVGPGEKPVVTIVKTNDVTVVASVIEMDVAKLQRDAEVTITLHAFPGQKFRGSLARIGRALDPATRTLPIEIDIPNGGDLLLPGMTGRVEILTETRPHAVLLPVTALMNLESGSFAYVVREDEGKPRARRVKVELGVDFGDWIEIRSGVSASDQVILVGRELVTDGTWVELVEATDLPPLPDLRAPESVKDLVNARGEVASGEPEITSADEAPGAPEAAAAPPPPTTKKATTAQPRRTAAKASAAATTEPPAKPAPAKPAPEPAKPSKAQGPPAPPASEPEPAAPTEAAAEPTTLEAGAGPT